MHISRHVRIFPLLFVLLLLSLSISAFAENTDPDPDTTTSPTECYYASAYDSATQTFTLRAVEKEQNEDPLSWAGLLRRSSRIFFDASITHIKEELIDLSLLLDTRIEIHILGTGVSIAENAFLFGDRIFLPDNSFFYYNGTETEFDSLSSDPNPLPGFTHRFRVSVTVRFESPNGEPILGVAPVEFSGLSDLESFPVTYPDLEFRDYTVTWSCGKEHPTPKEDDTYIFPDHSCSLVYTPNPYRMFVKTRTDKNALDQKELEGEAPFTLESATVIYNDSVAIPQKDGYTSYYWDKTLLSFTESNTIPRSAFWNTPTLDENGEILPIPPNRDLFVLYVANTYTLTVMYRYPSGQIQTISGDGFSDSLTEEIEYTYGVKSTFTPSSIPPRYTINDRLLQSDFTYNQETGEIDFSGNIVGDNQIFFYYEIEDQSDFYTALAVGGAVLLWGGVFLIIGIRSGRRKKSEI